MKSKAINSNKVKNVKISKILNYEREDKKFVRSTSITRYSKINQRISLSSQHQIRSAHRERKE